MKSVKQLVYWMNERQQIYLQKESGQPFPWTKDKILQEYKFTNVFREQDRETQELRKRLNGRNTQVEVFWKSFVFRMFNWHETYDALDDAGLIKTYNAKSATRVLQERAANGGKVFTGAYIISNNGSSQNKIELICEALTPAYKQRASYAKRIEKSRSIRDSVGILAELPNVAGFVGYEIATDLRHTSLLNKATDIMTWANPGPGAVRGLNRVYGRPVKGSLSEWRAMEEMRELLRVIPSKLDKMAFRGHVLEMRDIEHSLCEFDKYMRVKLGEGRPRSKYQYAA